MVIKASSSRQIDGLIRELGSADAVARDAAVARLIVIGARAVARLVLLAADVGASAPTRAASLRALAAIADPHAADAAVTAIEDEHADVAAAGVLLARALFESARGVEIIDRLSALTLDRERSAPVRTRAFEALGALPASTLAPLIKALAADADPTVADLARRARPARAARSGSRGIAGRLDEGEPGVDPVAFRRALHIAGERLPLPTLHRLLERVREREQQADGLERVEWTTARAAVHQALAKRNSRLALYDLRESLGAATTPLPLDMITALGTIGDASCLEPLVAAYDRIADDWWRRHTIDVFAAIVARERLTKRSRVVQKLMIRWPAAMQHLWLRTI